MIVVSDTSPINYLILTSCVDLLPRLFGQVITPPTVLEELSHPRAPGPVRDWASSPPEWLIVKRPKAALLDSPLGPGEAAAIALAEECGAYLLIDERDGRAEAHRRGLTVVGTLAVLDRAASLDLVDLPEAIERLRATNFHVSETLLEELLRRDRERSVTRER